MSRLKLYFICINVNIIFVAHLAPITTIVLQRHIETTARL